MTIHAWSKLAVAGMVGLGAMVLSGCKTNADKETYDNTPAATRSTTTSTVTTQTRSPADPAGSMTPATDETGTGGSGTADSIAKGKKTEDAGTGMYNYNNAPSTTGTSAGTPGSDNLGGTTDVPPSTGTTPGSVR